MRIAVLHHSVHHHNTESIATAIAAAVGAKLITLEEARNEDLSLFDVLGLGSGIFFGKHHPRLLAFAAECPHLPQDCFIFSTAGIRWAYWWWHRPLVGIVQKRGCKVIGQFCSPGWDTVGPLKYIGGIHRGRPNVRDLEKAGLFAQRILAPYLAPVERSHLS